jgi:heptosyltransferase II
VKAPDAGEIRSILIRGTNWVGDAVIAIPAMREIRRLFPQARISLLVRPWVRDIYAAREFVDEILEYDKDLAHNGWRGFCRIVSELKARRFDMAILFQNAFEAALMAWSARIPQRVGYARDGRGFLLTHPCRIGSDVRQVHQAYYYLNVLSEMGWMPDRLWEQHDYRPSIRIHAQDSDIRAAEGILRSEGIAENETVIGVNPGAFYGPAKRWFPERYAAVADAIAKEYNSRVIVLGSSGDLPVAQQVAAKMETKPIILAGRTTLGQLMGLIHHCRLLITNDSGPMHLAAALDVPQLAIFGSTSEIATGPLSPNAVVVKNQVDCNPCFLRECPTDYRCMEGVTVQRVLGEARKALERDRGRT